MKKILIKKLKKEKWGSKQLLNFHLKIGLGVDLIVCRSADRKVGSGRPRSARTSVSQHHKGKELICSQEDAPGTHKSPREIEQITRIAGSSVVMLTDVLADHITASVRHCIN